MPRERMDLTATTAVPFKAFIEAQSYTLQAHALGHQFNSYFLINRSSQDHISFQLYTHMRIQL